MESKLFHIRVIRYALGVTLAMAISQGYAWLLSYLVPVLLLGYLAPPSLPLSIKDGLKFLLIIGFATLTGLLIGRLVDFPLVYLPIMFLLLMLIFYAKETFLPPLLKTWLLIAILLLPLLSLSSQNISLIVAPLLFLDALITILIVWFMYLIIPNPVGIKEQLVKKEKQKNIDFSKKERFNRALESTIVVFPIMMVFNIFQWNGAILILIFVAILSSMPNLSRDFKVGKFLILGNIIGGIVSIIFYNIMTFIPEFYFLLLLTFLLALIVGYMLMSEKPIGKIFGSALSTVLIILGSVFSSDDEAGSLVWIRVFQIIVAVSYVVFAFRFIEEWKKYLLNKRMRNKTNNQTIIERSK